MDELHRFDVLFVATQNASGRKALFQTCYEAESESAARQSWIDAVDDETDLGVVAYVDPATISGIVRIYDLGPVVERPLVDSPFVPDVTVVHDGERLVAIAVDWLCSYQGRDFASGSIVEDDRYASDGPRLFDAWLDALARDADAWLDARRGQDSSEAFRLVGQMRCLLGNYTLKEFT